MEKVQCSCSFLDQDTKCFKLYKLPLGNCKCIIFYKIFVKLMMTDDAFLHYYMIINSTRYHKKYSSESGIHILIT